MDRLHLILNFIAKIFGQFSYQPPAWLKKVFKKFQGSRAGGWLDGKIAVAKKNPRKTAKIAGGVAAAVVLIVGGIYGYMRYLDSLPKPDYLTVSLVTPTEPDLETNKPDRLVVSFSKSAARIDQLDKPLAEGVTLKPAMKGSWRWESDRQLIFEPEQKGGQYAQWEIGTKYRIILERKLFPKHVLLEELEYKFETPQMKGRFSKEEFYQDPRDPDIKRAVFNIHYNYALDTEDFKKRLEMNMQIKDDSILGKKAKKYAYTVSFGKFQNEAFVVSDPIPIPKKDSIVHLLVGKGVRAPRGGSTGADMEGKVDVPGMFDLFHFEESQVSFARNAKFEPEQILILKTKAELPSETIAKSMKLYLLPKRKPKDEEKRRFSVWSSASEVTPEVRKEMTALKFTVVPAEEENSKIHTFKIDVPVGRYVYIEVPKGLKSFGGYELQHKFEDIVSFPDYPKELMIMSQGSILSFGGDKKVPLLARNIKKAEFHLYRILPSQLNQFVYHNFKYGEDFGRPAFSNVGKDTLSEVFEKKIEVPFHGPAKTQYFSIDLDNYMPKDSGARKGIFFVEVQSDEGQSDQRLILVTDLGLVVKESNDKTHEVFVQNLRTGAPVGDAEVTVIGANGLDVVEQRTNSEGMASFPDLRDFKFEKRPVAFVVKKGADMAYLPFKMRSRELQYSRFDIGGLHENPESDQLTSYIFSDRGIYRPGDSVNLGMMVRARNWKKYFKSVPLMWTVTDPRGTEVKREKLEVSSDDLTSLTFATQDAWATGIYQIRVFITKKNEGDEMIGSLSVRVEEFLPDRMKISAHIEGGKPQGWVGPQSLKGLVTLTNLFGTPAENRRVVGEIALNPAHPWFKQYKDYQFTALKGDEKPYSETLQAAETDEKGEAHFDFDLARFTSGMYTLRFDTEGFEAAGGRAVSASTSTLVSTLPYLLGLKSQDSLNYVTKDSKHEAEVIAINPDLTKIAIPDAQVVIVERRYVSALMQQSDGTYKYHSVLKEISGEPKAFAVGATGSKFKIPTETPGDFVAVFKNKAGVELNRLGFSVAGEANLSRSLERNAELQVVLNKTDYKPGDEIELSIKAPYTGSGLITIERDKVFAHKWFKTSTTSAIEKIRIPAGVEGGAYVNVTFLRAIDSPEIFMSPLSYSVAPFSISLDEHKIELKVDAPALVKPGEKLNVKYSASKKTKLILYGVDEGILQVAGYKLPSPMNYFFQRQALQVLTYQLLDLLLPEYSVLQKLAAPGGDEAARLSKNLNPFKRKTDKPVVFWSGVLEAGSTPKTFSYEVPDYFNGNIKVMAVASNGSAFGAAEQGVLSRGDFIITSNIPTFVVPGDEFVVGVGLSNQAEGSGANADVKLELAAPAFEVLGPAEQSVKVAEGHEGSAEFRLKAKAMLGSQPIKFKASHGNKSAKSSVETSVRPAVPYMTTLTAARMPGPGVLDSPLVRELLPEFRTQTASLSPIPATFIHGLKIFLEGHPYGCSEQLTSKAMPYVILKSRPEFGLDIKKANEAFKIAVDTLRTRQTNEGGFGMYSADAGADRYISLYVAHMLIEAKDRGFSVPEDMLTKVLTYLENENWREVTTIEDARFFAYSLYLRARAGKVHGEDLKFLHQALKTRYKEAWQQDLAAAWLAAAFKLVKQDELGHSIFRKINIGEKITPNYYYFYDRLVRDATVLFLGSRHFPDLMKEMANDDAMTNAFAPLSNGNFSTHSAAFAILALDGFFRSAGSAEMLSQIKISEMRANGEKVSIQLPAGSVVPKVNISIDAKAIRFESPRSIPFFYMQVQAGFDRNLPAQPIQKALEVTREYLNSSDSPVTSAKMGEEVKVRIRMRTGGGRVDHVVLVDMLPSGLEPVLEPVAMNSDSDEHFRGNMPGHKKKKIKQRHVDDEEGEGEPQEGWPPPDATPEPEVEGEEDYGAFYQFFKVLMPEALAEDMAKAAQTAVSPMSPNHVERREDRIVIYTQAEGAIHEFVYKAKAIAKGKFVVPPAFAESMYDRDVQYRGMAGSFTVEAP